MRFIKNYIRKQKLKALIRKEVSENRYYKDKEIKIINLKYGLILVLVYFHGSIYRRFQFKILDKYNKVISNDNYSI